MVNLLAQDSSAVKTDSLVISSDSLTMESDLDRVSKKQKKSRTKIHPWENRTHLSSEIRTTDSLLRWQIFPNWGDYYAYRNDVISFRRGTIGRTDAFTIRGFNQQEHSLWLNDVSMNNPITQAINYNYVPHHKIGKLYETTGATLQSFIDIRDYYINEPISYLNFDEAPNDYRNLEFLVSQNFTAKTNLELSYWDRRDGGFYPNNVAAGSQIMAKLYHHLGDDFKIEGLLLRNSFSNNEPGGYIINNPLAFGFGEFTSQPRSSSGSSDILRSDFKIGLYHRSDSLNAETTGLILNRIKNDRSVKINSDTLAWNLVGYQTQLFRRMELRSWSAELKATADYYSQKDGISTIAKENWMGSSISISNLLKLTKGLSFGLNGSFKNRNTDHSGYELSSYLGLDVLKKVKAKITVTTNSKMPSIQQLYWNSKNYSGNLSLENEQSASALAELKIFPHVNWEVGTSHRILDVSKRVGLLSDSTFSNLGNQKLLFNSAYLRFQNKNFEIESSVAYQTTLSQQLAPIQVANNYVDSKLWIRNSFFYKTYAFKKATFIKMGIKTLTSPFNYQSKFYNTELAYWQSNSLSFDGSRQDFIPAFFRLDAELSARVRAIMVVLRYENALDGVGQAGYFEASAYPMPPRRLVVGIRAQFRN